VVTHGRPIETRQTGEERGKAKEEDGATRLKRLKTEEIRSELEKIQIHFLWMASGAHSRRRIDEDEERWSDRVEESCAS
jgi:hypothetical protein